QHWRSGAEPRFQPGADTGAHAAVRWTRRGRRSASSRLPSGGTQRMIDHPNHPPPPAGRRGRACASLLAAAAGCAVFGAVPDLPPAERPVVEAGTVGVRAVTIESWIPGSIVSRADARIASVIAGRVVWVAEVGTRVGQGEAIARLDDTVPRLSLEDLRAQVAR